MKLKYASELGRYQNCPPDSATPKKTTVFRFVHADLDDERNFLPVAKLWPARRLKNHQLCKSLALSVFTSEEAAVRFFQAASPRIQKTVGTHLAQGDIGQEDGRMTPPERNGHMSLYEADGVEIVDRFSIVTELVNEAS